MRRFRILRHNEIEVGILVQIKKRGSQAHRFEIIETSLNRDVLIPRAKRGKGTMESLELQQSG